MYKFNDNGVQQQQQYMHKRHITRTKHKFDEINRKFIEKKN